MTEQNINLGLNAKECLKSTSNFFETIYHDVCTGQTHVVKAGTMNIAESSMTLFVCLITSLVMIILIIAFISIIKALFKS
jgi:hypothetical protein